MMIQGYLDRVNRHQIDGWARNKAQPDIPVRLIATANGELIARFVANKFRSDVASLFNSHGNSGFSIDIPPLLAMERYTIEVRGELDGKHLRGSPWVLQASTAFNAEMKRSIGNMILSAETHDEIAERLAFLASQRDEVLQLAESLTRRDEKKARRKFWWRRVQPVAASAQKAPPQALVIDDRVPVKTRDAGSVAIISHMLSLQRLGLAVSFVAADLGTESQTLQDLEIKCLGRPWFASVEETLMRNRDLFEFVYIHRIANAVKYLPLVRHYQPDAHIIFSVADLGSLRLERQGEIEQRFELEAESRSLREDEIAASRQADAVITHSTFEASLLKQQDVAPDKIHVVPFSASGRRSEIPFAARSGLAFIGGYEHSPNVDAARWLAEEIMPEVAKRHPKLECLLVGNAMPPHLRALASPTILPIGAVDDLAVVFDRVRLTVAPLSFGAGVKGKVLESLAAGMPCVCTPIAAEGLDLPSLLQQLIASDPVMLADIIVRLHEDRAFNEACAEAGLRYVADFASEAAVDARMRAVLVRSRI